MYQESFTIKIGSIEFREFINFQTYTPQISELSLAFVTLSIAEVQFRGTVGDV